MKKNIETKNENINVVENNNIEPIMDEETLQAVVEDNMYIVPKNQMKKFMAMTLEQKANKIRFYQDIQKMKEDAKIKNALPNKVKELFERRRGTVQDAMDCIKYLQEFVDGFKQREIEKIDEEIARLEEMKQSLNS